MKSRPQVKHHKATENKYRLFVSVLVLWGGKTFYSPVAKPRIESPFEKIFVSSIADFKQSLQCTGGL